MGNHITNLLTIFSNKMANIQNIFTCELCHRLHRKMKAFSRCLPRLILRKLSWFMFDYRGLFDCLVQVVCDTLFQMAMTNRLSCYAKWGISVKDISVSEQRNSTSNINQQLRPALHAVLPTCWIISYHGNQQECIWITMQWNYMTVIQILKG